MEMLQKRMQEVRKNGKKGFTLAELLIVVAIVMVLAAIAIPIFTGALGDAKDATAQAQIRSVQAALATEVLLDGNTLATGSTGWTTTTTVTDGVIADFTYSQVSAPVANSATEGTGDNAGTWTVTVYVDETTGTASGS